MAEDFTTCKKCDARILQSTAQNHVGMCAPCAKKESERWCKLLQYFLTPIVFPAALFGMLTFFVMVPCVAIYSEIVYQYRQHSFPFSIGEIELRIKQAFPNDCDSKTYIRCLINGFYEPNRELSLSELDSIPSTVGIFDGRHLANGLIEFESLPDATFADSYRRIVG